MRNSVRFECLPINTFALGGQSPHGYRMPIGTLGKPFAVAGANANVPLAAVTVAEAQVPAGVE